VIAALFGTTIRELTERREGQAMRFEELDTVVLQRDLGEYGLRAGDMGTVVYVHAPPGLEVEFIKGSGDTVAVVTLLDEDVRARSSDEVLAVRRLERSG
jgi:hypothetical protein